MSSTRPRAMSRSSSIGQVFALMVRSGFGFVAAHFFSDSSATDSTSAGSWARLKAMTLRLLAGSTADGGDQPMIGLVVGKVGIEP